MGDHLFTVYFAGGAEELQQQLSAAPSTPSFDRQIISAAIVFINQELEQYYQLYLTVFFLETFDQFSYCCLKDYFILSINL